MSNLQSWAKGFGTLFLPPPLFGRKFVSDCQFTVFNTAMPRFPPPPRTKLKFIDFKKFFKRFRPVTPNTVLGGEGDYWRMNRSCVSTVYELSQILQKAISTARS